MTSNYASTALIYEDSVPIEPRALRAWIDSATNAQIDPISQGMSWR